MNEISTKNMSVIINYNVRYSYSARFSTVFTGVISPDDQISHTIQHVYNNINMCTECLFEIVYHPPLEKS